MRTLHSVLPSPPLRPFVRAFAQRTSIGIIAEQQMPAFLETVLQFDFADLPTVHSSTGEVERGHPRTLVGPHTAPGHTLLIQGAIDSFAVFLHPTALWSLFGLPPGVVMETHYDSADVLGTPMAELWEVLAEAPGFGSRVEASERFLRPFVTAGRLHTPTTSAADLVARSGGRVRMSELASSSNIGMRQLERSFRNELGISPKRFARVTRFQVALDLRIREPDLSWLTIAMSAGYHDQMHLVHDFHEFGGLSPTRTLERLGDSRPVALAAHDSDRRAGPPDRSR